MQQQRSLALNKLAIDVVAKRTIHSAATASYILHTRYTLIEVCRLTLRWLVSSTELHG